MRFAQLPLHLRQFQSGIVLASLGLGLLLLLVCFLLKPLQLVADEVPVYLLYRMYEIVFPLVAVCVYAQLLAVEFEERIFAWLNALPLSLFRFVLMRWMLASLILFLLYAVSGLLLHLFIAEISWRHYMLSIGAPAVLLGNLALFCSVIARNSVTGLIVPLGYWAVEIATLGHVTGPMYLFLGSVPSTDNGLVFNRGIMWGTAVVLWAASMMVVHRRVSLLQR